MVPRERGGQDGHEAIREGVQGLELATTQLRAIRDQFHPIYTYYFPESWLTVFARQLNFRPQPDFSRYLPELESIRERTWRIIKEAERAAKATVDAQTSPAVVEWARACYYQLYLDGSTILVFNEYVKRMHAHDPEAMRFFMSMRQFARDAQANVVKLRAATKRVAGATYL